MQLVVFSHWISSNLLLVGRFFSLGLMTTRFAVVQGSDGSVLAKHTGPSVQSAC